MYGVIRKSCPFRAYLGKHFTLPGLALKMTTQLRIRQVVHLKRGELLRTHVLFFLRDFSDVTKDFKYQLLENYSTNFFWNTCTFVKTKQHSMITTESLLYSIFFIVIIVFYIVWRTEISMNYSEAAKDFSGRWREFNRAHKKSQRTSRSF